jgi:hypothetical protein
MYIITGKRELNGGSKQLSAPEYSPPIPAFSTWNTPVDLLKKQGDGDAGEINVLDFRVENHFVDVRDRSMKPRQTLCNRTTTVHVVSLQPNNNRLHDVSYKRSVESGTLPLLRSRFLAKSEPNASR